MSAPSWMESLVREFGKGAGLSNFTLNDRGVAALAFENGASLRFEYAEEMLARESDLKEEMKKNGIPARI